MLNARLLGLLLAVFLVLLYLWIVWPLVIGAIFVPTPIDAVMKILEIANVSENDILIDLGSGDGRIILEAAKRYHAISVGIEADPLRVLWSRFRIRSNGLQEKVEVVWGNFFRTDLSNATVVTVYQGQGINNKLKAKFERELETGTRIVTYSFTFPGWEPIRKDLDSKVYLYRI